MRRTTSSTAPVFARGAPRQPRSSAEQRRAAPSSAGRADVHAHAEEAKPPALVRELLVEPGERRDVVGGRCAELDGGAVAQQGGLDADERR
jgi:hypothetical protein